MRYSPGGDIYFGALLNSFIHVLMYSYYVLALMKVSCPWKKYLTLAQLIQFTSVVVYTVATAYLHYYHVKHEEIVGVQPSLRTYYFCCAVQVFEMVSLFILFSLFFKKSYSKKNKMKKVESTASVSSVATTKEEEDACHKAMGEISTAAKEAAEVAAKDAKRVVKSATKAVGKVAERDRFC